MTTLAAVINDVYWNHATIREKLERDSIRSFVESCTPQLAGHVLDYGCGKQPYRYVVEGVGGEYRGYDRLAFPANVSGEDIGFEEDHIFAFVDTVLCNQVLQYVPDPQSLLREFYTCVEQSHGWLVLTYPTNWDEVESADLWRFTRWGMESLVTGAGFEILRHERRAEVNIGGFRFPLGYGLVARA